MLVEKAEVVLSVSVFIAVAFLQLESLGQEDLGGPVLVNGEGQGLSGDGVVEVGLRALHVCFGRVWRDCGPLQGHCEGLPLGNARPSEGVGRIMH